MKQAILMLACIAMSFTAMAQIGYQVSLLDQDTGAPRAYELITAIIELTDNDGNVICSETKSATSNEFGVISLTVGDENTFDKMDWSKLPLWISATVDGVIIGKSQVPSEKAKSLLCPSLNMPNAPIRYQKEYCAAKHGTEVLMTDMMEYHTHST